MFKLEFETDNDAFQSGDNQEEVAKILATIAKEIAAGKKYDNVRDVNGNKIGYWLVK
jgi:hypothetical protein